MSNAATAPAPHVALIYARVSDDPKKRMTSVNDQIAENTEWITDQGWIAGRVIIDDDRSASRFATRDREGFRDLVKIIQEPNRPETVLVTWEPSRLSRISEQIHQLTDLMAKHNLLWSYDQQVFNLRKTRDKAKVRHDGVDSEKESDQTSDRVGRHMRKSAQAGKPHGRVPYGYDRQYDTETGESQWVINPNEAAIIREAAERFLSGESTRSIAKDFGRREIPTLTGTDAYGWQSYMVRRVLSNHATNGKRKHSVADQFDPSKVQTSIYEGNWEAIIDDITFARIQARFSDPSRKTIRQREASHILTGVARCGVCKGPMGFAFKRYKDGRERGIYGCRQGNHVARHREPLEDLVAEYIIDFMSSNDIGHDDPTPELVAARARVDGLKARKSQYEAMVADMDPGDYIKAINALNDQIRDAEKSVKVVNMPTVALAMNDADDPRAYWFELATTERGRELQREILRALIVIYVHPATNWGSHKFDPSTIEIVRR